MRIVFLGSPPFAVPVLDALLASRHEVLALVTRPDRPAGRGLKVEVSPLVTLAREAAVEVQQPASTKDTAFLARLRELAPDALLVASYGEILREELLALAPRGAFNVHASLLPRHRGASPIQAAILAGDAETGVSVQRMVKALDEGDVLLEERTPIGAHENAGELLGRLAELGGTAAVRALDLVESGKATFTPQDPSRATYAPRIRKEAGTIDWTKTADEVARHVRAMTPWPGARSGSLVLIDVRPLDESTQHEPGTLLDARHSLRVACGRGTLEIARLKPAGKGPMDGAAWLRGARLEPGAELA